MIRSHDKVLGKAGFLHPGQMGVTIAAALASAGHSAYWTSQGRSAETVNRAELANLEDLSTLDSLCKQCDSRCRF